MRNYFFTILILLSISMTIDAQISFIKNTTWEKVIEKAKAENKLVFVDCYTTWCGPCKWLDKNTFQDREVGELFNANFVNLKLQMDTTVADSDYTRSWRSTAEMIDQKHKILGYPSFLIFDGNGTLVDRGIGAAPASEFIMYAKTLLDPTTRYYSLKAAFDKGDRSPEKTLTLAKKAMAIDPPFSVRVIEEYLKTQDNWLTMDNVKLLFSIPANRESEVYKFMLKNEDKIGELLKAPQAFKEYAYGAANSHLIASKIDAKVASVDWKLLRDSLQMHYPKYADQFILKAQISRANTMEDWPELVKALTSFKEKYADQLPVSLINNYAWDIFLKCTDKTCLEKAATLMKAATEEKKLFAGFIDTYANLLYKIGHKKEAIEYETKAMELAKAEGQDESSYKEIIEKMMKGESTWE